MVWYDRLRYRLMPYIYTLGADTYFKDGTIMRGLVMDFAADKRSLGHRRRISVRPRVPRRAGHRVQGAQPQGLSARRAPTGTISTPAEAFAGGQTITAAAPYERMPLFVRAGSIVPTGPAIQYTGNNSQLAADAQRLHRRGRQLLALRGRRQSAANICNGKYARIPLSWNERTKTLTIGAREGSYPGMAGKRDDQHPLDAAGAARALAFDAKPDATVTYAGAPVTVRMR